MRIKKDYHLEINKIVFSDNSKPPRVGLVTAAAGGTGQFAVQLLKNAGVKQIFGTCSNEEKVQFLKSIGATHPINLTEDKLGLTLRNMAPRYGISC